MSTGEGAADTGWVLLCQEHVRKLREATNTIHLVHAGAVPVWTANLPAIRGLMLEVADTLDRLAKEAKKDAAEGKR